MQEVFEKIIDEIKKIMKRPCGEENCQFEESCCENIAFMKAIEIVNQEAAEYNNGWIPCSERLPEINKMVLLYAPYMEYEPISIGCLWQGTDENRAPYFKWFAHWEDNDTTKGGLHYSTGCPYICPGNEYVLAWKEFPEPYQPKEEKGFYCCTFGNICQESPGE